MCAGCPCVADNTPSINAPATQGRAMAIGDRHDARHHLWQSLNPNLANDDDYDDYDDNNDEHDDRRPLNSHPLDDH